MGKRAGGEKRTTCIAELYVAMLDKGRAWYDREREGIALIEGFQSALLAVRDVGGESEEALSGLAGNADMDPWLAEDLFQQVQELSGRFEELLEELYTLQTRAREIVLTGAEQQVEATELRPVDYLQMMSQELATFEAEYQHIEALLHLLSFETTTDELRTLVISWSTSPFLDPAQTRTFQQRHQLSQRLHT